jgi:hypothetical protein
VQRSRFCVTSVPFVFFFPLLSPVIRLAPTQDRVKSKAANHNKMGGLQQYVQGGHLTYVEPNH